MNPTRNPKETTKTPKETHRKPKGNPKGNTKETQRKPKGNPKDTQRKPQGDLKKKANVKAAMLLWLHDSSHLIPLKYPFVLYSNVCVSYSSHLKFLNYQSHQNSKSKKLQHSVLFMD